jgi:hypothetical protein
MPLFGPKSAKKFIKDLNSNAEVRCRGMHAKRPPVRRHGMFFTKPLKKTRERSSFE